MKYFIEISLFVFIVLVTGCTASNKVYRESSYSILDTVDLPGKLIQMTWLDRKVYPILYIGNLTDTIYVDHALQYYPIPPPPIILKSVGALGGCIEYQKSLLEYEDKVKKDPLQRFKYKIESIMKIGSIYVDSLVEIKVDTNFTISKCNDDTFFEAYPIIVSNLGKDTLLIGYQRYISIIVEAKDSLNKWSNIIHSQKIQGLPLSDSYMLIPGFSVITPIFKTTGNYKTRLRIKIGNNYSNEWIGNINYNQFNSVFDEKGECKSEYSK